MELPKELQKCAKMVYRFKGVMKTASYEEYQRDQKYLECLKDKDKYVWYVCYGSNLAYKRFMSYITGDPCKEYYLNKSTPCIDLTPPIRSIGVKIPYHIYLADYSINWNGSPAFLHLQKDANANTYGRAYLISREQYEHVKKKEGNKYTHEIKLDPIDGIEAKTFTNEKELIPERQFSPMYYQVMFDGLKELGISEEAIKEYLDSIIKKD